MSDLSVIKKVISFGATRGEFLRKIERERERIKNEKTESEESNRKVSEVGRTR